MLFEVKVEDVQHVRHLNLSVDLNKHGIICIAGKNGSGKTTLIRSIQNLKTANTFRKTASPYIFCETSKITYNIDGEKHEYSYNEKVKHIDSRTVVSKEFKEQIFIEQPIPHGVRFNHAQKLSNIDEELRKKITLKEFSKPTELINFLNRIYSDTRFENLKEVSIKGEPYYFILLEDDYYIREDYFSSGEYFVTHLYKLFNRKSKLIAIDEIDISLDSSAQVNLIKEVRRLCQAYEMNILFTTHSLALMRTLQEDELFYMENDCGEIKLHNKSFNFIKSLLFGFLGWDKYILVEDKMLEQYISHTIFGMFDFYRYKIIYIGGSDNVTDLLERNAQENFLSDSNNVIAILDGDVKGKNGNDNKDNVFFVPFDSVEKEIGLRYRNGELDFEITMHGNPKNYDKILFKRIIRENKMTIKELFEFINFKNKDEVQEFTEQIGAFLQPPGA